MTLYCIKVIFCSALFIFTYKVLLEKQKMHCFNRFYLLSGLLLSFVIPMIIFSSYTPILPTAESVISYTSISPDSGTFQHSSPVSVPSYTFWILFTVYVIITTVLFYRYIINLKEIFYKTRNHSIIPYNNSKIVLINEDLTPHSFLYYIFVNKEDYNKGSIENEILIHEQSHVKQKHSYDIMFIEILQAFFWFNPFLFLYRKSIQLNHEFLADEAVITACQNTANYQYLLINKENKHSTSTLTSQFNYLIIKKRLLMMTKTTSFFNSLCRQISLVPVLALSIFLFSTKTFANSIVTVSKTKQEEPQSSIEGISQDMLNEYEHIVNKSKNKKGFTVYSKFSYEDKSRLKTIYLSMSKDQQAQQIIIFIPHLPLLPRTIPTKKQFESFKNSKIYGLWINDKRVSNTKLIQYENTDFAQVFISKIEKNLPYYGKYFYQVDLMTTEYYGTYYKQTIEENKKFYRMAFRMSDNYSKVVEIGEILF